jgi:hypothetical protein
MSMMLKKKPVVLIMTATIRPPINCPDLVRSDPEIRSNDYSEALKYYLNIGSDYIDRIIFVDNSDSDLGIFKDVEQSVKHEKTVEFISIPDGNKYPPEYGKGYGEMMMINYVLDNAKIITKSDIFWKATGRLILLNIESLIKSAPHPYAIYSDLHNSFNYLSLDYFFDPRFYSFTMDGYNNYLRYSADKLKYAHIEHYYFDILKAGVSPGKVVPRFKKQPVIKGYSAAANDSYFTFRKRTQRKIQQILRYVAPWVWF